MTFWKSKNYETVKRSWFSGVSGEKVLNKQSTGFSGSETVLCDTQR